MHSRARINVVAAGRRAFKTEGAKRRLVLAALECELYDGQFFATAPTYQQAKDIFWKDLKLLIPRWALRTGTSASISESELRIELKTGVVIRVSGLDVPERIEGGFWDGGVITEFGNTKADLFDAHIRPMMVRGGWCDIEGVPEGRNHYYETAIEAQSSGVSASTPEYRYVKPISGDWAYFHWTTAEVLWRYLGREFAAKEVESARRKMDPIVFDQEYNGSFVSFTGRAYYNFTRETHGNKALRYDPTVPLAFCFDFNESPGVAVVCQEGPVSQLSSSRKLSGTRCIGEVYIPRHSKTPMVCERLIADWGKHKGPIYVYGDATGGAGGSAKVEGSDWELVWKTLKPFFGTQLRDRVARSNPAERARVNSMNSRLKNADDEVRLIVCRRNCPRLIKDLEGVGTVKGGSGELDKKGDRTLTHISDAVGYYVAEEYPISTGNEWSYEEI